LGQASFSSRQELPSGFSTHRFEMAAEPLMRAGMAVWAEDDEIILFV
jgi:hypothetical protein